MIKPPSVPWEDTNTYLSSVDMRAGEMRSSLWLRGAAPSSPRALDTALLQMIPVASAGSKITSNTQGSQHYLVMPEQ
jgi:hypothetical protein